MMCKRTIRTVFGVAALAALAACAQTNSEGDKSGMGRGENSSSLNETSRPPISTDRLSDLRRDLAQAAGDRVTFETDSVELTADAKAILARQADWLGRKYPDVKALIEGHADERGTREYNFALGERRAKAVIDYLKAKGIAANRLRFVSYGKERPDVAGADESAWSQNRRAVTVLE